MNVDRRYVRDTILWIAGFVLLFTGIGHFADRLPPGSGMRYLLLLPLLVALAFAVRIELRLIASFDERERTIYLIAGLTGSMCGIFGAAVALIGETLSLWDRVSPLTLIAVMSAGFLAGAIGASRRYG